MLYLTLKDTQQPKKRETQISSTMSRPPPHDANLQSLLCTSVLLTALRLCVEHQRSHLQPHNDELSHSAAGRSLSALWVLLLHAGWSLITCQLMVSQWQSFCFSFHFIRVFSSEHGVHSFQSSGQTAWGDSQSLLQRIWLHIWLLQYALDKTTWRKTIGMDRTHLVRCK